MNDTEENLKKMYLQIIESDKTTEEQKWDAQYWLWYMERSHLVPDPETQWRPL